MKRILVFGSLLVVFALSLLVFSPVSAQNNGIKANAGEKLEKISSLKEISFYKNIVKKDGSLYGVRKENKSQIKKASSSDEQLEKIAAPQHMNMYEKIRKVGNALWGYKKAEFKNRLIVSPEISACVISALETKDTALAVKNTAFAASLNEAIASRTACQKEALATTTGQVLKIEICAKSFASSTKALRDQAKKEHDAVWKAYRESLAVCAKSASSTVATQIVINDGGGSIIIDVASEQ
jgi:hypothetical protein